MYLGRTILLSYLEDKSEVKNEEISNKNMLTHLLTDSNFQLEADPGISL